MTRNYKIIPYSVRQLSEDDFAAALRGSKKDILSGTRLGASRNLIPKSTANLNSTIIISLGLFHYETFVGWSTGYNIGLATFYIDNSAIHSDHRGRGFYLRLMQAMIGQVTREGFQSLKCHHFGTMNELIALKLRLGFAITGLEISEEHGSMVLMEYFINKKRSAILRFRTGESRPSVTVRKVLKL